MYAESCDTQMHASSKGAYPCLVGFSLVPDLSDAGWHVFELICILGLAQSEFSTMCKGCFYHQLTPLLNSLAIAVSCSNSVS